MTAKQLEQYIGKKVLVDYKGLILTGTYQGPAKAFSHRDGLVKLPLMKRATSFYFDRINPLPEKVKP